MDGKSDKIDSNYPSILKRRKVRKGTSSCWECRYRKKRCDFEAGQVACVYCLRYRLECVSQEYSEPLSGDEKFGNRVDQIEKTVMQLVQQRNGQTSTGSTAPEGYQFELNSTLRSTGHERLSRGRSLSGYLFSILPDPAITVMIMNCSRAFRSPLQIAQNQPSSNTQQTPSDILPTTHPVLLARRLITLALCLQHSNAKSSKQLKLREPVNDVAQRYFTAACHFVTSQDFLISSLDGLQTLMLQGRYYITNGDLNTAWLINHRAANIACSMGFPHLAELGSKAETYWLELLYTDRFLSLILGLPFVIHDNAQSIPDNPNATPAQKLERIHIFAAGCIITRNLRMQQCKGDFCHLISGYEECQQTRNIDQMLKKAMRLMPAAWWLVPSLDKTSSELQIAENTPKILIQMHQYYLIALLHQPHILPQAVTYRYDNSSQSASSKNMYSNLAAVSASRELITRYLMIRNYQRSPSHRAFDDKGFMASLILLFAHFHGHRLGDANVLEHQRPQDIGIIGKVADLIEELSASDGHSSDESRAKILRKFLEVEADAADGTYYNVWKEDQDKIGGNKINTCLQISIPYFGTLRFTRQELSNRLVMRTPDLQFAMMSEFVPKEEKLAHGKDLGVYL